MLGQPKSSFYNIRLQRNYSSFQHTQHNIPSEKSHIILPLMGKLLHKLEIFFGQHIPKFL